MAAIFLLLSKLCFKPFEQHQLIDNSDYAILRQSQYLGRRGVTIRSGRHASDHTTRIEVDVSTAISGYSEHVLNAV